jgi:hypothetical protein
MTRTEVQANFPIAGEIHSLLGNLEQAEFHRPSPSIQVDRLRTAVLFFDE